MPHITIEYMIMIPVLILQIFIFPFTAAVIMNTWTDSRMTLELQETASHLGSSVQQLYYTINHGSISSGSLTVKLDTPTSVEGYPYTITLHDASNSGNQARIMNLTLDLRGTRCTTSTLITLGQNANWVINSRFSSTNSTSITATKNSGSISLTFDGGAIT